MVGRDKFESQADYDEYVAVMNSGGPLEGWQKKVNGLCASDYSPLEEGSVEWKNEAAEAGVLVAQARKATPLYSGVRVYFPDALEAIARVSLEGNKQHDNGDTLHWDRSKSKDEYDSADRHLNDRAKGIEFDTDGHRHMAKAAWRCMAALQKEIEAERAMDTLLDQGGPDAEG